MSMPGRNKTWFIAIFLIPAVIYIFYFYLGSREAQKAGQIEPIPQTYQETGTSAKTGGGTYQVGADEYGVAFLDTLKAGNNTIMPEPGFVFAVVPVLVPSPQAGGQPDRSWLLIDDSGRIFKPLSTDTGRLTNLKRLEDRNILPGTMPDYLVFKVKTGIQTLYLKLSVDQNVLYWRLPGPR